MMAASEPTSWLSL